MPTLDDLRRRVRRTADAAPSVAGFSSKGLDAPDDQSMVIDVRDDDGIRHADLAGLAVAIEYVDAAGNASSRRITVRRISIRADGRITWSALCHERRAVRAFRGDRIQCVIDLDGVIHDDAMRFLSQELGLDLTPPAPGQSEAVAAPQPKARRISAGRFGRLARDGLTVLAALARADGLMDDAEVGVMLAYAAAVARAGGQEMPAAEGEKLAKWLRRLRPERDAVTDALGAIAAAAGAGDLLLRYAVRLMDADGVHHPDEFAFAMDVQDRLS